MAPPSVDGDNEGGAEHATVHSMDRSTLETRTAVTTGSDVVAMDFTEIETQLNACSLSGAPCVITIGADITWAKELTVAKGQNVTFWGRMAGGAVPALDAKASYRAQRRHLTVADGATLSLDTLKFMNGYVYYPQKGGSINNLGSIERIDKCMFSGNKAVSLY